MHDEKRIEGIVLVSTLHKEFDRVVKLMTDQEGVVSVFAKKIKTPGMMASLSPFSQVALICQKTSSELYFLKELSLIDLHLSLRDRWSSLEVAGKIVHLITKTQMAENPAPLLYQLLRASLHHLPRFQDPETLLFLFHLKLWSYEGSEAWDQKPHLITTDEWHAIRTLALSRSFSSLYSIKGLAPLYEKWQLQYLVDR